MKYTEKDLVDFGKYLLSKERDKKLKETGSDKREVYHADLKNWK